MIEKLFESLDKNVFTDELIESLQENFDSAVEAKATIIADEKINEAKEDLLKESEAKEAELKESYDNKYTELEDRVDEYLEKAVDKFMSEAKESLDADLSNEKSDAIIEAADSMMTAFGKDIADIVEAKDATDVEKQLEESIAKYDELVEENIELKNINSELHKAGVINEMKEGLSLVESEKFEKLAVELVEFSDSETYATKLESLKESIKTDKVEDKKVEDKKVEDKASYSHLI